MKYNLTFWQRFWLPLNFIGWWLVVDDNKKSWHEVKKGMEKHEHKFTIPHEGIFLMCEHEGCYLCDFPGGEDTLLAETRARRERWDMERQKAKEEFDNSVKWMNSYLLENRMKTNGKA